MTSLDERASWLAFSRVRGVGAARAHSLVQQFGSLLAAWNASERDLRECGLPQFVVRSVLQARRDIDVPGEVARVQRLDARFVTLADEEYPYLLRQIPNPPMVIYVRGELTDADQRALAVVGTRKATRLGAETARALSTDVARSGFTIVSGLAQGIDFEAHTGALEAAGRTIAVLGTGIDMIYPRQHTRLADDITRSGALVTEFAPGTPPDGQNFPRRNRIISGLSLGVLIVEAPERSGALVTATAAAEQGRDVFAVPASLNNVQGRGCNRLIQDGAKLVMSAADILSELAPSMQVVESRRTISAVAPDDPFEQQVYTLLRGDPLHIDDLVRTLGCDVGEALAALTMLELKGLAQSVGPMQYCALT
ncbi:MAG: DNA-protecting protein DprA [Chloroflexi bacterium]|nr:DNA-protecting protein DprA [Chloroflexota bacterium]